MELPIYTRDAEAEIPFNQAFLVFFQCRAKSLFALQTQDLNS